MKPLPLPLHLRPFRLADAEVVGSWLRGPGLAVPRGSRAWPERLLQDQRIVALVAHAAGRPCGLVRLDCAPDGVAEITMVVAPEHRREGHGRRIFAAALERARQVGMRRLVAYVDLGSEAALAFFGEMGFESAGVRGGRIRMDRIVHAGRRQPPLDVRG